MTKRILTGEQSAAIFESAGKPLEGRRVGICQIIRDQNLYAVLEQYADPKGSLPATRLLCADGSLVDRMDGKEDVVAVGVYREAAERDLVEGEEGETGLICDLYFDEEVAEEGDSLSLVTDDRPEDGAEVVNLGGESRARALAEMAGSSLHDLVSGRRGDPVTELFINGVEPPFDVIDGGQADEDNGEV